MDILADFDDFSAELEPQFDMDESSQASDDLPSKKTKQTRRKPRRRKRMLTGVSKQRRAANERERRRLQIINNAFIGLKDLLPLLPGEENISKIEVVKLASRTILLLQEILDEDDQKRESETEESRSSCGSSYSSRSCSSIDSIESFETNTELDLQDSHDFSYLLFPSDDMKLDPFGDSMDTGLSIPSPCISDSSYTSSSKESSEFPFMEDDPMKDDVFQKGPTMCLW
ncbi:uncharacterized protein LOC135682280 [Rhopilema esculentum]|uniref:uncharacterized protein LOC135682280 n=1 Tax=Rhopilema esculentum TaxID=499914 RepID=UPI0031DAC6A6|eukprot:gene13973-4936_t